MPQSCGGEFTPSRSPISVIARVVADDAPTGPAPSLATIDREMSGRPGPTTGRSFGRRRSRLASRSRASLRMKAGSWSTTHGNVFLHGSHVRRVEPDRARWAAWGCRSPPVVRRRVSRDKSSSRPGVATGLLELQSARDPHQAAGLCATHYKARKRVSRDRNKAPSKRKRDVGPAGRAS